MFCKDCQDLACLGKVYQVSFHWDSCFCEQNWNRCDKCILLHIELMMGEPEAEGQLKLLIASLDILMN